jgi:hypothetical protein
MNIEETPTTETLDNAQDVQPGSNDQPAVSALDILREMEAKTGEPKTEDTPTKETEPDDSEPEEDEDEDGAEADGNDDETPEGEDSEEEGDHPSLAEEVLATLEEHNPDAIKRWNEQWKGLEKRESKMKDWEDGIQDLFTDLEYARETVPSFLQKLAVSHGLTVAELVGVQGSVTADEDEDRFATDVEREHDNVIRQLQKKIEQLESQQTAERQRAEHEKTLDQALGRVQKVFDKEYSGFKVTRKMLQDAASQFPNLEPAKAVEAANARALVSHMSGKAAAAQRVNAPVMPKSNTSKGISLPDGDKLKAGDLLALLPDR